MAKYIGVTIGPIYQTIKSARSTGELWGSSYIFSYLMKEIIKALHEERQIKGNAFLVPYVPDDLNDFPFTGYNEAGLFPDRFIMKVNDELQNSLESVRRARDQVLVDFASKMAEKLPKAQDSIHKYIEQYIRVYAVLYNAKDDCQVVKEINQRLDTLELCARPVPKETDNYIAQFIRNKHIKNSFLYEDAFGSDNKEPLPLMHHIAAGGSGADITAIESKAQDQVKQELRNLLTDHANDNMPHMKLLNLLNEPECDIQQLEDWLEENKNIRDGEFMAKIGRAIFSRQINFFSIMMKQSPKYKNKSFKYMAVVKADGDGVGTHISGFTAGESNQIRKLSAQLFRFGQAVLEKIKQYGGKPIYIGGDDLLFIAPVISIKENRAETIFDLVDALSWCFQESLNISRDNGPKMSLSFGIAMTYYGYPLYESLSQADSCLKKAKENSALLQETKVEKNTLAARLIKHSGSSSDLVFNQASQGYTQFKEILRGSFPEKVSRQQEKFLKGLMHRLQTDRVLLSEILINRANENRLENYFKNNFDEKVHKQLPVKTYLNKVERLIFSIYKELYWEEEQETSRECEKTNLLYREKAAIDRTITCLQIIKFFQEEGDE